MAVRPMKVWNAATSTWDDVAVSQRGDVAPTANPTFTGVASFPDGSASAPSITNTGDTNTGVFFPAADTVAITTGGSERLRVTSTGNVGIGTTNASSSIVIERNAQSSIIQSTASTDANGSIVQFNKSRGTHASPSVVSDNDNFGRLVFIGYDGSANRNGAAIVAAVDGTPGASDMPGRISFQTVPSGSITLTERMRIDRNGLITGTGTSLGAWTAYTPTIGGTGWAIGDGTATGYYCQIGKTVHFRLLITFGASSTFGAGTLTLTMPVSGIAATGYVTGSGFALDASLGIRYGIPNAIRSGSILVPSPSSSTAYGQTTGLSSTAPFTFASGDQIALSGTYEAA